MRRYLVVGLAALLVVASVVAGRALSTETAAAAGTCNFAEAQQPVKVAFCDTFDSAAASNSTRSGALNPTVWGVSEVQAGGGDHFATGTNAGQGLVDTVAPVAAADPCGGTVVPPKTVQICDGELFDSVNDDGGQTALAMYPRQPFDIAGRTGTVTYDVTDNSQGIHAAWPTFVYTDQPVPAPYSSAPGIETSARDSFGFSMAQVCNSGTPCAPANGCPNQNDVTVDTMFETSNYRLTEATVPSYLSSASSPIGTMRVLGCVAESTSPTQLNQVEIRISTSQVQVWASDAGSTSLREIAELDNAHLPLTRGLVWIEDDHYNGDKFDTQQSDTLGWDNLGFDGPVLPRDLGFDVPNQGSLHGGAEQLGWATGSGPVTVTAPGVSGQSKASGALLELNWYALTDSVPTVSLNGGAAISTAWPFPDGATYVWRTIAIPVPLSEVRTGSNSITVGNAPGGFANVDLILQGAGGVPTCLDPSNCSAVTSSTPTPAPAPSTGAPSLQAVPDATFTSGPALTSWSATRYDLFGRGTNGALWHAYWTGSGWSGWQSLGGGIEAGTQPAAVAWAPNRIDVFVEGTDRQLWHKWWSGSGWSGWQALGGILSGSPAVASWAANRLDIVAPGLSGQIWHDAWTGSGWTGFQALGGATHATPAIAAWGPGRLDVFVEGTGGVLWHRTYAGGWTAWQSLGVVGLTTGPAAASIASGELDVVAGGAGSVPELVRYRGSWQPAQVFTGMTPATQAPALVSLRDGGHEELCLTAASQVPRCGALTATG